MRDIRRGTAKTNKSFDKGQMRVDGKGRTRIQGGAGGLAVGWVDLDLECSTILLGQ